MEALKNLDLGGQLQLRKLENATGADAKAAKLWDKKKLEELTLSWTRNNGDKEAHEEVLEGLRPHDGLKALRMYCCRSSGIPTWMLELQGMVELKLENCQNLEKLPALWQLQSLQFLYLSNLGNLRCLFSGGAPSKFQKLKMIGLVDMPNFEMWWDRNEVQGEEQIFPEAENLRIVLCQKLLALPKASVIKKSSGRDGVECRSPFPALKGMLLSGLDKFHRWEAVQGSLGEQVPNLSTSLKTLHIEDCKSLKSIAFGEQQDTTGLVSGEGVVQQEETSSSLIAAGSSSNEDESTVSTAVVLKPVSSSLASSNHCFFPCLESLVIFNCSGLTEVANLPLSIKTLTIWGCGSLVSLSGEVTSLEELYISDCKSLESLPHQVYSSLRVLRIESCDGIKQLLPSLQQCLGHLEKKNIDPHLLQEQVELDSKPESMSDGASTSAVLKQSSPTGSNHCFFPCLETLEIEWCHGLTEVANLPSSIKTLKISQCGSLVSVSGEVPSLEELKIWCCGSLESLPNGPHQVYSSIRVLKIKDCGGIKHLPPILQKRLDQLEEKALDRHLLQGPAEPVPTPQNTSLSLMSKLACFIYESCN